MFQIKSYVFFEKINDNVNKFNNSNYQKPVFFFKEMKMQK